MVAITCRRRALHRPFCTARYFCDGCLDILHMRTIKLFIKLSHKVLIHSHKVAEQGGATTFTKSDIFVKPKNGSATFFSYKVRLDRYNHSDSYSSQYFCCLLAGIRVVLPQLIAAPDFELSSRAQMDAWTRATRSTAAAPCWPGRSGSPLCGCVRESPGRIGLWSAILILCDVPLRMIFSVKINAALCNPMTRWLMNVVSSDQMRTLV